MPQDTATILAAAALVLSLLALVVGFAALARSGRSGARKARPAGAADRSLEEAVAAEAQRLSQLEGRVEALREHGRGALQRVGVVRFNPFEDTGSNQSFALAMLDERADGVVISSLHSRQSTRIYLKPISRGQSETPLSEEEAEALRRAGAT